MKSLTWQICQAVHRKGCLVTSGLLILALFLQSSSASDKPDVPKLTAEEVHTRGERMYRNGILPSGEPMRLAIQGEAPAPGTAYSCVSCHLRSGLGSVEEGIYTPATTGSKLYAPSQIRYFKYGTKQAGYFELPIKRPAYTDETLARALRSGVDPAGRKLEETMPRYSLDDRDMAILISYLKTLSQERSPGVSFGTIRLATIVTDDVSKEAREAYLQPLSRLIQARNNQAQFLEKLQVGGKLKTTRNLLPPPAQKIQWSVWLLTGPPESWRDQLTEYHRKNQVFALIGGMSNQGWQAIHQFCEENRIPALFPTTDLPVVSQSDWYTLYFSKGYYQEGEGAARYLDSLLDGLQGKILQIVRDSEKGAALARGFEETWKSLGHLAPASYKLKAELSQGEADRLLAQTKPAAVLLWDGTAAPAELQRLARGKRPPRIVMVSSKYLGDRLWSLKDHLRDTTYITYPYRLQKPLQKPFPAPDPALALTDLSSKAASDAAAIEEVLTVAVTDMKGNLFRDHLLDVIGMMEEVEVPTYERLTFGAGQRYATRGCYVVQLSKGATPRLIPRSDWLAEGR